jgi:membrane protein required for colicin V production
MTVVDVVVVFVILLSALFGVLRGFVKEAISLVKWVIATWIAATFAPRLSVMLPVDSEAVSQAMAFGLLFICVFIAGAIVSFIVVQFVKKTGLSGADRVFGLLFGFLRGGVIIVVFVVIGQAVSLSSQQWWQDSTMLTRFEDVAIVFHDYVPQGGSSLGAKDVINFIDTDAVAEEVIKQVNP